MLWDLFITSLMIGAVSFGGGYSMIPVMQREVVDQHGWMTLQSFTDTIAIAGMSPGPMATNSAVFIGYKTAGLLGAVVSVVGIVLPSLAAMVAAAVFFRKIQNNMYMKKGFYGLRPFIVGFIFYAAITFAIGNGLVPDNFSSISWQTYALLFIFAASFVCLTVFRMHPVLVILLSGLTGIALFG